MTQQGVCIRILHWMAKAMGILIKIDGMPYGSNRNTSRQSIFSE